MMLSLKILLMKICLLMDFKEFIKKQRDRYNNEKLKFERALKYSRIECYLDGFF